MSYLLLRQIHTLAAVISIAGFVLRGYWMLVDSCWLNHRISRIAPHIVDTILLSGGVGMLLVLSLNPLSQSWLLAKFAALILYILLGTVALRRGPTMQVRVLAFVTALLTYGYVVGVAISKSPASWLVYLR
jgi:uncharacterized membrane protein SirB2